jgi:hypothetical protein
MSGTVGHHACPWPTFHWNSSFQDLNRKNKAVRYEPMHLRLVPRRRPTVGAAAQISSPGSPRDREGRTLSRRRRRTPQPPRWLEDEERQDTGLANESYKRSSRARSSHQRPEEDAFGSGRARGVVSEARVDPPMATPLLQLRCASDLIPASALPFGKVLLL